MYFSPVFPGLNPRLPTDTTLIISEIPDYRHTNFGLSDYSLVYKINLYLLSELGLTFGFCNPFLTEQSSQLNGASGSSSRSHSPAGRPPWTTSGGDFNSPSGHGDHSGQRSASGGKTYPTAGRPTYTSSAARDPSSSQYRTPTSSTGTIRGRSRKLPWSFLSTCSLVFELQPSSFPSEHSRVAYVITLLSGRAREWGTAVWEANAPECQTFTQFAQAYERGV